MNNHCYRHEIINSSTSLFPIIDCSYVLIMNNSKYEKRVRDQLNMYPFSNKIVLQWNSGFRKCAKNLPGQHTVADIVDAYIVLLENAIANDSNYIMILEEDFIVDDRIKNYGIRNEIMSFITRNKIGMFTIGSILWKTQKVNEKFAIVEKKSGVHCLIINKVTIRKLYDLITTNKDIKQIDVDHFPNQHIETYTYHIPLVIQLITPTENQTNWGIENHQKNKKQQIKLFFIILFYKIFGFANENRVYNAYELNYKVHFDERYSILKKILAFLT